MLGGLQQKAYLEPDTVQELEECLKDRDTNMNGDADPMSTPHGGKANGAVRPDKRQIEQRIEEDRERHKKQRESIWAVKGEHEEFDKLWDDGSDIEGDDELEASEDAEQRAQAAEFG